VGPTPWHGGRQVQGGLRFVKIGFYLDHLTRDTGCLRVVPGSQKVGVPDLLAPLRGLNDDPDFTAFGLTLEEIPCVALEVELGDIVVFTECVLHASFGGLPSGRHQHAINFFANPKNDAQTEELKQIYRRTKWSVRPTVAILNSARPRVQRMISRLVELGHGPPKM